MVDTFLLKYRPFIYIHLQFNFASRPKMKFINFHITIQRFRVRLSEFNNNPLNIKR